GLKQFQDDVLDILSDVAGFSQCGGIDNGERYVQNARQSLGHQRLASSSRADQQDVRFGELDLGITHPVHVDALRVVINGDSKLPFGGFLSDHVLIEEVFDLKRLGDFVRARSSGLRLVVLEDQVANRDALVADVS